MVNLPNGDLQMKWPHYFQEIVAGL